MLGGCDGEEGDFCEALSWVHPITDSADDFAAVLKDDHGLMVAVEHQLYDVLLGHLG